MTKKILIDEAVVKQALEALKSTSCFLHHCWCDVQMNEYSFDKLNKQMEIVDAEITALREALQANNEVVNVLTEQPAQQAVEPLADLWEMFPGYLIDKYEGETLTEELLQQAVAELVRQSAHGITSTNKGD